MDINLTIESALDHYSSSIRRIAFSGDGSRDFSHAVILHDILCSVWKAMIAHYNLKFGSNCRKPLEAVIVEAGSRGFSVSSIDDYTNILSLDRGDVSFEYYKRNGNRFLIFAYHFMMPDKDTPYRVKLDSGSLLDCMEEFIASIPVVKEALDRRILTAKREYTVDRISYPTLCNKAEKSLSDKKIKYYISLSDDGAVLNVNIVKEIWFCGPVDIDSIEGVLNLVPYGIKRPDRIREDIGSRFSIRTDISGRMEKAWNSYRQEMVRLTGNKNPEAYSR